MNLTMDNLKLCFSEAKKSNAKFIGIAIAAKNAPALEVIINPTDNFDFKSKYYESAYDDSLHLKSCPDIKIVGFTYADSFQEVQSDLIG